MRKNAYLLIITLLIVTLVLLSACHQPTSSSMPTAGRQAVSAQTIINELEETLDIFVYLTDEQIEAI